MYAYSALFDMILLNLLIIDIVCTFAVILFVYAISTTV
jgi:uncharacterized membrane protein